MTTSKHLDGVDLEDPTAPPIDPPDTPTRSRSATHRNYPANRKTSPAVTASATEAVRARWATESAVREDLERHFKTAPIEEAMALLARMRTNCEIAGHAIEQRRTEETLDTECFICRRKKREMGNKPWRMVTSFREVPTNTWLTVYLCTDMCVIQYNKSKGVNGIPDRGVVASPADKEDRSKRNIMAHQEKMRQNEGLAQLGRDMAKQEKRARR